VKDETHNVYDIGNDVIHKSGYYRDYGLGNIYEMGMEG